MNVETPDTLVASIRTLLIGIKKYCSNILKACVSRNRCFISNFTFFNANLMADERTRTALLILFQIFNIDIQNAKTNKVRNDAGKR